MKKELCVKLVIYKNSIFLLYFGEIITLLVMETNRYYHGHLDRTDNGPSPLPDVTEAEMLVFLARTIQMLHRIQDKLADYWAATNRFHTRFYSNAMKRNGYLHILSFLQSTGNNNEHET
jgi:hypothetical protein